MLSIRNRFALPAIGIVFALQRPRHARYRDGLNAVRSIRDVLVLSRKTGERILIGDEIAITVVKVAHGGVRIGVEAPTELAVVREELAGRLAQSERDAAHKASEADPTSRKQPAR